MTATRKRLLSIVVPVFNEEVNIQPFHDTVRPVLDSLAGRYEFEFVFTDNHSTDATFAALEKLAADDGRVRVLRFSRNFGYQRSILTGYLNCRGEAAVQLDVDLQDPPDLLPEFINQWEAGHQVVYGVRRSRKEAMLTELLRKIFYRLIHLLSEEPLPIDAGDFRLIDRQVIEVLRATDDAQPYLRGAIATMGFNQIGIPYDRAARTRGESKFPWRALVGLAIDGILNHSIVPLRLATYTGLVISVLTFLTMFGYVISHFVFGHEWPRGFATLVVLILFSVSLNALFLGVIGEYIGRIYRQVKKRPITVIERSIPPREPTSRA